MVKLVLMISLATCFLQLGSQPSDAATSARRSRMQSTNGTESAPLNSVSRSFARLAIYLEAANDSDRLTYRALDPHDLNENASEAIGHVLLNVAGGPSEASIQDVEIAVGDAGIKAANETFTERAAYSADAIDERHRAIENFGVSIKTALVRPDIVLYSARLNEKSGESQCLVLIDQETGDLLVLIRAGR